MAPWGIFGEGRYEYRISLNERENRTNGGWGIWITSIFGLMGGMDGARGKFRKINRL